MPGKRGLLLVPRPPHPQYPHPQPPPLELRPPTPTVSFDKIGTALDPTDMLTNGSKTLHSVGDVDGVTFTVGSGGGDGGGSDGGGSSGGAGGGPPTLQIVSYDAGLVSPGPAQHNKDLCVYDSF